MADAWGAPQPGDSDGALPPESAPPPLEVPEEALFYIECTDDDSYSGFYCGTEELYNNEPYFEKFTGPGHGNEPAYLFIWMESTGDGPIWGVSREKPREDVEAYLSSECDDPTEAECVLAFAFVIVLALFTPPSNLWCG